MPSAANAGSQGARRDPQLTRRLLIKSGAIGDTVVWLPAAEFLRTDYTEVWCSQPALLTWPERVQSLSQTGIDLLELGLDDRALRAMVQFDEIWCWYGASRQAFRSAVEHLPIQLLPALPDGSCHAVDFYLRQVNGPEGLVPGIAARPRQTERFVAMHPFSGSARKNWPLERFRQLAEQLSVPVQFTAGPEEALDGAVRFSDLLDLAEWLASASVYIGNDSGVSHIAAAVGTPSLVIFRASNPDVWCPRGSAPVLAITSADENGPEFSVVAGHAERLIQLYADGGAGNRLRPNGVQT